MAGLYVDHPHREGGAGQVRVGLGLVVEVPHVLVEPAEALEAIAAPPQDEGLPVAEDRLGDRASESEDGRRSGLGPGHLASLLLRYGRGIWER